MSRAFTPQEQAYLASLPAVSSVSENTITYAPQFRASCMDRYYAGESPMEIFRSEGLDPALIGAKRIERCVARDAHAAGQARPGGGESHPAEPGGGARGARGAGACA